MMKVHRKGDTGAKSGSLLAVLIASHALVSPGLSAQSIGDRIRVTTPGVTVVGEVTLVDDQGLTGPDGQVRYVHQPQ